MPPSATSEGTLTIDFFESGVGETIRIIFPDGGVGIVDAHPSRASGRPPIQDLVSGRRSHFVCLTHPHADHGLDLIPVLRDHPEIGEFWHTLSDISVFIYAAGGQLPNYRSPIRGVVAEFQGKWGRFLTQIYGHAAKRKLPHHKLRSDIEATDIAGVVIHFLAPDEDEQNRFTDAYREIAIEKRKNLPDPNALSAVLALEYKGAVVLLGADALKKNWEGVLKKYHRLDLPAAAALKVPHHGAANALELRSKHKSYLDVCSDETIAVLFAGDANHPDPRVNDRLQSHTVPACLANGLRSKLRDANPLEIAIPGAQAVAQAVEPCQSHIRIEIGSDGQAELASGHPCSTCRFVV